VNKEATMATRTLQLEVEVIGDGQVALRWQSAPRARSYQLLIIRTGAVRAYTTLQLSAEVLRYQINSLSRHQRYLIAVLASGPAGVVVSDWWSTTPRAGAAARAAAPEESELSSHLAQVRRLSVMPQDRRLTAYWETSKGFIDQLVLEVAQKGHVLKHLILEPEVTSISLDADRGVKLTNGERYVVRLHALFAAQVRQSAPEVLCAPAPQGLERTGNRFFPQESLIYPCLSLSPELRVFEDEPTAEEASSSALVCRHCRQTVRWQEYRLRCAGCGAEYIPNGRGEYLEVSRLRFGTCRCCLPKKILIQKTGGETLLCAHSGKEHIRMPDAEGFHLIEDLPHGLCQCCRPRRPLLKRGGAVVCSKSGEKHRNEEGRYVLVPSELVLDAAAIDDLLDAGLAEICATGVSRGRR
jgi:hypothetical protein